MSQYTQDARVFKALCDESRLNIIDLIRQSDEICACILLEKLPIGQSTLSHHMKILVESGLITARKDGKKMLYAMSLAGIDHTRRLLDRYVTQDNKERGAGYE